MSWLENAWYKGGKLNYLLAPLSLLFWLISGLRRWLFQIGVKKQNTFDVPVIVVGNISVGGTGKTPFVIYLVELLKQQGFKPAIVSRGYGSKKSGANKTGFKKSGATKDDSKSGGSKSREAMPFPRLITADTDVALSGDEPKLLAIRTQCPVVIDSDRSAAVNYVIEHTDCDVIISDDGLQHYAMSRDLEFVLLDQSRMFGNGWLLPVGPLRELSTRLKSVDLVLENNGFVDKAGQNNSYGLSASKAFNLFDENSELPANSRVHLISGIGNPERFFNTVTGLGFDVVSTHWLPDHHQFEITDFQKFSPTDIVVMTEKDAVKCKELVTIEESQRLASNWYVLPIEAVISETVEKKIVELITPFKSK